MMTSDPATIVGRLRMNGPSLTKLKLLVRPALDYSRQLIPELCSPCTRRKLANVRFIARLFDSFEIKNR